MTITDWIQAISMVVLVAVTIIYAKLTHVISKASNKQAEATKEQAEEMKELRYSESLPLLVPTIPPILRAEKLPIEAMQSGNTLKVVWCNVGKGVAINTRFSFSAVPTSPGRAWFFPPGESITLEVRGEKTVDYSEILNDGQLRDISEKYCPYMLSEYQDIYERKITTVQEFRIEEQNDYKRVLLGDLYFTVNGRRLGQE